MPVLAVIVALLILISGVGYSLRGSEDAQLTNAELVARSKSMLFYRGLVVAYINNHPGFSGVLSDGDLSLPDWYMPQGVKGYVEGGIAYVYLAQPPSGLVGELARVVESVGVGTNTNGVLYSPSDGNTGIAIPAVVPLGSTVIMQ